MPDGWRFLIDENLEPQIAEYLQKESISAEHVRDALHPGADDRAEILPYLRERDGILVTNDVRDFGGLADDEHQSIVLLFDGERSAFEITAGILDIVEAYGDRDSLRGYEVLDDWI